MAPRKPGWARLPEPRTPSAKVASAGTLLFVFAASCLVSFVILRVPDLGGFPIEPIFRVESEGKELSETRKLSKAACSSAVRKDPETVGALPGLSPGLGFRV